MNMHRFIILFVCLLCISCNLWASVQINLPQESLLDEKIAIQVIGLDPFEAVTIQLGTHDHQNQWKSSTNFIADEEGAIGQGDPMDLFYSLEKVPQASLLSSPPDGAFVYHLEVIDDKGKLLASASCKRRWLKEGVCVYPIGFPIVGTLFLPKEQTNAPLCIVLGGSEGGEKLLLASLLASHNIPSLSLAYHGKEGLVACGEPIALEYFETAFSFLDAVFKIDHYSLYGISKGADIALLLASLYPQKIAKVVAVAPSGANLSKGGWTYQGEPFLPKAPQYIDWELAHASSQASPFCLRKGRQEALEQQPERFEEAMIPVENITCPILFITGGDDQVLPTDLYVQKMIGRLDASEEVTSYQHLHYPQAGHGISVPYLPCDLVHRLGNIYWNGGGSVKANQKASADSWEKAILFLGCPSASCEKKQ